MLEIVLAVLIPQVVRPAIVDIFTHLLIIDAYYVKTYFQDALLALLRFHYLAKHVRILIMLIPPQEDAAHVLEIVPFVLMVQLAQHVIVAIFIETV